MNDREDPAVLTLVAMAVAAAATLAAYLLL
jgi:hypothetical protein